MVRSAVPSLLGLRTLSLTPTNLAIPCWCGCRSALFPLAFKSNNSVATKALGVQLLAIIDDYDLLLSSDTNFMLGRWLEWAKDCSDVPANKAQLEFNARNILTLWG